MSIKVSTGLATYLMVTGCAKDAFALGLIKVYSGTVPATADDAGGTVLWTISVDGDGTGLTFDSSAVETSTASALVKPSAAVWAGATTAGVATYWRLVGAADTGADITTEPRIQGTCGSTAGADLYMSSTTLITDASITAKTLASFSVALPFNA